MVDRFDVYLVSLDPEPSTNAKNTRPCVVISPNEINHNLRSVIIAPISSSGQDYPTRIKFDFLNGERYITLDQIRSVDQHRLVKKIGVIEVPTQKQTIEKLHELFAE